MDAAGTFLIVVDADGSEHSRATLHWAVDEAGLRHGEVRAITAWHYPPVPSTAEDRGTNDSLHAAEHVRADALKAAAAAWTSRECSFGIPPPQHGGPPPKTRTRSS